MSIEISDEQIRQALLVPLRENLVVWKAQGEVIEKKLTELICDVLIICAATTERKGPTLGIKSGISLIHGYKDR